ncbi:MAG: hypothetical protein HY762_06145 [Planctomycetes bacterium]|nr:hypothetical protein [Planctomycetota bacterium]
MTNYRILFLCVLCVSAVNFSATSEKIPPSPYTQVAGVIHLQTPVSGGQRTINDYIQLARQERMGILIVTDHDTQRYEYGLWPLRGIIRKVVERESVLKFGAGKYLDAIRQTNQSTGDVLVIDGVESTPYYYWGGSYFGKNLTLNNRGKHLLVIGLNKSDAYENLPLIANDKSRFSQYEPTQSYEPYQDLIDYVVGRQGLVFWAHPEARETKTINNINIDTPAYPEALKATTNYTGFAVLGEGYQKIGIAGGIWDEVLSEYCAGKRNQPIWAIGELDDYGNKDISTVQTIFLLKQKSYQGALDALRNGKVYALSKAPGKPALVLEDFYVAASALPKDKSAKKKTSPSADTASITRSGEQMTLSANGQRPTLRIKVSHKPASRQKVTLKVIKNGKLFKEYNQSLPIDITLPDDALSGSKTYYRLDVIDESGGHLISNPIFVR